MGRMGRVKLGTRVGMYLSEVQLRRLRQLTKKTSLSMSEHMRRAIDEYLDRQKKGGR